MLKSCCSLPHKTLHREDWDTGTNPNQFYSFLKKKKNVRPSTFKYYKQALINKHKLSLYLLLQIHLLGTLSFAGAKCLAYKQST